MTKTVGATYEKGVLKLDEPLELDEQTRVRVAIDLPESPRQPAAVGKAKREPLVGIIEDAPEGVPIARDHDRYIYG